MFTRVFSSTAIPSASRIPIVPKSSSRLAHLVRRGSRVDDHRARGREAGDRGRRAAERLVEDDDHLRRLHGAARPDLPVGCGEAHEGLDGSPLLLRAVRGEVGAVQPLPQHAGLGEHLAGEVRAEPSDRLEADAEEAIAIRAEAPRAHAQPPLRGTSDSRLRMRIRAAPYSPWGFPLSAPPRSAHARMGSGGRRATLEVRSEKEERWPRRSGRSPPPATSSR